MQGLWTALYSNHKIPISEWIGFLLDISGFGSFSLTSKVNRNASSTTKYWMEKTFLLLEKFRMISFLKTVYGLMRPFSR
jgi:hypothetical protein